MSSLLEVGNYAKEEWLNYTLLYRCSDMYIRMNTMCTCMCTSIPCIHVCIQYMCIYTYIDIYTFIYTCIWNYSSSGNNFINRVISF